MMMRWSLQLLWVWWLTARAAVPVGHEQWRVRLVGVRAGAEMALHLVNDQVPEANRPMVHRAMRRLSTVQTGIRALIIFDGHLEPLLERAQLDESSPFKPLWEHCRAAVDRLRRAYFPEVVPQLSTYVTALLFPWTHRLARQLQKRVELCTKYPKRASCRQLPAMIGRLERSMDKVTQRLECPKLNDQDAIKGQLSETLDGIKSVLHFEIDAIVDVQTAARAMEHLQDTIEFVVYGAFDDLSGARLLMHRLHRLV
jgi:hypothetical protein